MESQPLNPEIRINPENFHPCVSWMCHLIAHYVSLKQPLEIGFQMAAVLSDHLS